MPSLITPRLVALGFVTVLATWVDDARAGSVPASAPPSSSEAPVMTSTDTKSASRDGPEGPAAPDEADLGAGAPAPVEPPIDDAGQGDAGQVVTMSKSEDKSQGRVHSKWHLGFGLGPRMLSRSNSPGSGINVQVGGRINDHFSLGADLNAMGNDEVAFASALAEVIYFPSARRGFNLQAGGGAAASGRIASTTTIFGGFGYGAAVGWDWQIKRRFNIGLHGRFDGLAHPDRHLWTAGAMLSFTWW